MSRSAAEILRWAGARCMVSIKLASMATRLEDIPSGIKRKTPQKLTFKVVDAFPVTTSVEVCVAWLALELTTV